MLPNHEQERKVVVDAGAAIKLQRIEQFGSEFFTTEEVHNEIKDTQARRHLQTLPFELQQKQPFKDDYLFVKKFATATGDVGFLSQNDMGLLALAVRLHRESGSEIQLRDEPEMAQVSNRRVAFSWAPSEQHFRSNPRLNSVEGGTTGFSCSSSLLDSTTEVDGEEDHDDRFDDEEPALSEIDEEGRDEDSASASRPSEVAVPAEGEDEREDDLNKKPQQEQAFADDEEQENKANERVEDSSETLLGVPPARTDDATEATPAPKPTPPPSSTPAAPQKPLSWAQRAAAARDIVAPAVLDNDPQNKAGTKTRVFVTPEVVKEEEPEENKLPMKLLCASEEEPRSTPSVLLSTDGKDQDEDQKVTIKPKIEEGKSRILTTGAGVQDFIINPDEESSDSDDDWNSGWVTSENINRLQNTVDANHKTANTLDSPISVLSADYSVQNVAIQMGLQVVSLDGLRIRSVKLWGKICRGCFATTRDTTKMYCPKCGNPTLDRCPYTLDAEGRVVMHDNRRRKPNLRGTVYSIPKRRGGRAADLLLREDEQVMGGRDRQIRYEQRLAEKQQQKREKDGIDIVDGWCARHITGTGNAVNRGPGSFKHGYGGRRNPNANNFKTQRFKK
ncbi:unnamed protein product [Amoebophrya sp. A120]|nr:unnamed protein product [Amoebophrya sp. A120]|eukprot:GSA120T00020828001.1